MGFEGIIWVDSKTWQSCKSLWPQVATSGSLKPAAVYAEHKSGGNDQTRSLALSFRGIARFTATLAPQLHRRSSWEVAVLVILECRPHHHNYHHHHHHRHHHYQQPSDCQDSSPFCVSHAWLPLTFSLSLSLSISLSLSHRPSWSGLAFKGKSQVEGSHAKGFIIPTSMVWDVTMAQQIVSEAD